MASDGTGLDERASAQASLRLAWSPAGDRLLLERQAPGGAPGASAIFLASLDGTELRQVTPQWTGAPDWSSTGRIAFVRSDPRCAYGCPNIFLTRLGGKPRRLTHRAGLSPSWSPHGRSWRSSAWAEAGATTTAETCTSCDATAAGCAGSRAAAGIALRGLRTVGGSHSSERATSTWSAPPADTCAAWSTSSVLTRRMVSARRCCPSTGRLAHAPSRGVSPWRSQRG